MQAKVATRPEALKEAFGRMPQSRVALETGTHSPWMSRLLSELGHEAIAAHARDVRLIGDSRRKDDKIDAQTLARLARIDPQLRVALTPLLNALETITQARQRCRDAKAGGPAAPPLGQL